MLEFKKGLILLCCAALIFCGCVSGAHDKRHAMETYYQALQDTEPHENEALQPGSAEERAAIERFVALYTIYTEDNIRSNVRDLYAPNAYYRDSFTELQGIENIEAYLIEGTHMMHDLTFDLQDVAVHEGDYYFRWITRFSLKRDRDEVIHFPGMDHLSAGFLGRRGHLRAAAGRWSFHQMAEKENVVFLHRRFRASLQPLLKAI
jgi:hypothetical protein